MLVAAILLGLVAVFFARSFLLNNKPATITAVRTVPAVVATQPFAFGEKIVVDKLKVVQWPASGIPAGTFQRIADAVEDGNKVALRAIDANELITVKALSGKASRLSASPLFGPAMRAVAVPIGEVSGAGGFIAPGDRVDVYLTHGAEGDDLPYTDQFLQNIRVLAIGQDSNVGKDKPELVKTATLEVTPLQAQRIALAQSVGQISLSLRNLLDESQNRLETAQIQDLNDGTVTRILRKRKGGSGEPPTEQARTAQAFGTALGSALRGGPPSAAAGPPALPTMEIYRGTAPTSYPVPTGQ